MTAPSPSARSPWRLILIIGGIVGALIAVVVTAVVVTLGAIFPDGPDRGPGGEVTEAGVLRLRDLQAGDCISRPSDEQVVREVRVLPCAQAHDAVVFAAFDLPEGPYPGDAEVAAAAATRCDGALAARPNVGGTDYALLRYAPTIGMWYPTKYTRTFHKRPVVCLLAHRGSPTTGRLPS